jgi:hypothetical protein
VNLPADYQRVLPILLVAVVALGAAVLVVRGLGGTDKTTKAQQIIDRAAKQELESGTVQMHMTTSISSPARGVNGTFEWNLSGQGSNLSGGRKTGRFHITEQGPGERPVSLDELSTGTEGFIRVGGSWYRLSDSQYRRIFKSDDTDPLRWIVNPKLAGTTRVDGVEANDIRGAANMNTMLADLDAFEGDPTDSPAARRVASAIKAAPKQGSMDLQVGKHDGVLRRGSIRGQVDAVIGTTPLEMALALTFSFTDVNEPVRVEAPQRALPPSLLGRVPRAKLGSQAHDIFGARKPRRGPRSYVTCVSDAPNLAALERCQSLLPRR